MYFEIGKCLLNCSESPISERRDKNLGQRERVCAQVVINQMSEQRFRGSMVLIVPIEVGDEDARIKDDQSGHSSRRRLR